MDQSEEDNELTAEQRKKHTYSIIVVLIGVLLIGASFAWHLWSALSQNPGP